MFVGPFGMDRWAVFSYFMPIWVGIYWHNAVKCLIMAVIASFHMKSAAQHSLLCEQQVSWLQLA